MNIILDVYKIIREALTYAEYNIIVLLKTVIVIRVS